MSSEEAMRVAAIAEAKHLISKPRIFRSGMYWYACWPVPGLLWVHRRCLLWSIAVEQVLMAYATGEIRRNGGSK